MSVASPRFAAWIAGLFALAAVPVLLHASTSPTPSCAQALRTPSGGTGMLRPDGTMLYQEIRVTTEPSRLYGPVLSQSTSASSGATIERRQLDVDGVVLPLRWQSEARLEGYRVRGGFFVLDGEPVEGPFLSGLAGAHRHLAGGRPSLTRIVVYADGPPDRLAELTRAIESRLAELWRRHRELCES